MGKTLLGWFQRQPELADHFDALQEIGVSLAAERNIEKLLDLILRKSRGILSADAGSIFLVQGPRDQPTHLRFCLAQNDSVPLELSEVTIPIDRQSLAGYVAVTREPLNIEDVYQIPADRPFRFFGAMDQKTGYLSKSLLSVAMIDHRNHLIGVVQLWNKKKLSNVVPFTATDAKLLSSIASQAGVAVENALLYEEINNLFKGFIETSVRAIEARDPTTFGHSERVCKLTVGLAKVVDRTEVGAYGKQFFTSQQLRELEYAALLHDFGKIGVRESVLTKSKKLYPWELEILKARLHALQLSAQIDWKNLQLEHLMRGGKSDDPQWLNWERETKEKLAKIEESKRVIEICNEPTVLHEDITRDLLSLKELSVLDDSQLLRLAVRKGSLSPEERKEIESHVSQTYKLLQHIPWTQELKNIPDIAHAHHEKLDGTGYPLGIRSSDIPVQSKIMAIADIFDALTARDRPYKKAVPVAKSLEILKMEAKGGQIDGELLKLFVQGKVFETTTTGD